MRRMAHKEYAAEVVRLRTGRDVEELLRELYIEQRHSQAAVADALGVSRQTVALWLARYGMSRDDREPISLEATA